MKGVEMAPNVLVIVVLAVLVLLAIVGFFMPQWGQGSETLNLQAEHSRLCNLFVLTGGCEAGGDTDKIKTGLDLDGDPNTDETLTDVCERMGIRTKVACKESCGC